MPRIFIKLSKFLALGLMPFLLVSSSSVDLGYDIMPIKEYFSLEINDGDLNNTFHIGQAENYYGVSYNTIEIQLNKGYGTYEYAIQFVISREESLDLGLPGDYEISDISGLLKEFNSVFGVATIKKYGETPFFAKKGSIHLEAISNDLLKGTIDLRMVSTEGIIVNVAGNFEAVL